MHPVGASSESLDDALAAAFARHLTPAELCDITCALLHRRLALPVAVWVQRGRRTRAVRAAWSGLDRRTRRAQIDVPGAVVEPARGRGRGASSSRARAPRSTPPCCGARQRCSSGRARRRAARHRAARRRALALAGLRAPGRGARARRGAERRRACDRERARARLRADRRDRGGRAATGADLAARRARRASTRSTALRLAALAAAGGYERARRSRRLPARAAAAHLDRHARLSWPAYGGRASARGGSRRRLARCSSRTRPSRSRACARSSARRRRRPRTHSPGSPNHRSFHETMRGLVAARSAGFALVLADIDDFKELNDTRGHVAGDDALREVGALLRRGMRPADSVFRIGGEEFALLLPETTEGQRAHGLPAPAAEPGGHRPGRLAADAVVRRRAAGPATAAICATCCRPPTPRSTRPSASARTASRSPTSG